MSNRRALFLDRDGVINHEIGYLFRPEDVRFVAGVFSLCRVAADLGYSIVIVTNQSGIARGLYTEAEFHALMDWMAAEFRANEAAIDRVYFCPYHPEHGVGSYRQEHEDRKPGAGMLRRAAADLELDLAASVMVGDRCSDIAAANTAGLREAFLLADAENVCCPGRHRRVASLSEVERWLAAVG